MRTKERSGTDTRQRFFFVGGNFEIPFLHVWCDCGPSGKRSQVLKRIPKEYCLAECHCGCTPLLQHPPTPQTATWGGVGQAAHQATVSPPNIMLVGVQPHAPAVALMMEAVAPGSAVPRGEEEGFGGRARPWEGEGGDGRRRSGGNCTGTSACTVT